ncbi:MAG: hypothetical protein ACRED5_03035 [Propylenella sp.]
MSDDDDKLESQPGTEPTLRRAPSNDSLQPLLREGDAPARIVLVSLLELAGPARRTAVAEFSGAAAQSNDTPVFLTDDLDFSIFAERGSLYEYLPPIAEQVTHGCGQRWNLYIAEKMKTILAKWQPTQVASPGLPVEDFIRKTATAHAKSHDSSSSRLPTRTSDATAHAAGPSSLIGIAK